jgi:hypothetical protein
MPNRVQNQLYRQPEEQASRISLPNGSGGLMFNSLGQQSMLVTQDQLMGGSQLEIWGISDLRSQNFMSRQE